MDLREARAGAVRHPWELARRDTVLSLLSRGESPNHILDIGCGDGWLLTQVCKEFGAVGVGVDTELDRERTEANLRFIKDLNRVEEASIDCILLLDVIEHVSDDVQLIKDALHDHDPKRVLITVPAFQSLYSEHDRFLGHHRRYTEAQLVETVRRAGLSVEESGYFFSSLLLPRALICLKEKLGPKRPEVHDGVGRWTGGVAVTAGLRSILRMDAKVALFLNSRGVKVPGLSLFASCKP